MSDISTHTPMKGVTLWTKIFFTQNTFLLTHPWRVWRTMCVIFDLVRHFYSHTHEGCDVRGNRRNSLLVYFYSHTHEGCDCLGFIQHLYFVNFYSHTHEGCDWRFMLGFKSFVEFLLTHPWRVWRYLFPLVVVVLLFLLTHPWRVWRLFP